MLNPTRYLSGPRLLVLMISITFCCSACASSNDSAAPNESLAPDSSDEECYCSVRKRKQVEKRLNNKNKSEPDS